MNGGADMTTGLLIIKCKSTQLAAVFLHSDAYPGGDYALGFLDACRNGKADALRYLAPESPDCPAGFPEEDILTDEKLNLKDNGVDYSYVWELISDSFSVYSFGSLLFRFPVQSHYEVARYFMQNIFDLSYSLGIDEETMLPAKRNECDVFMQLLKEGGCTLEALITLAAERTRVAFITAPPRVVRRFESFRRPYDADYACALTVRTETPDIESLCKGEDMRHPGACVWRNTDTPQGIRFKIEPSWPNGVYRYVPSPNGFAIYVCTGISSCYLGRVSGISEAKAFLASTVRAYEAKLPLLHYGLLVCRAAAEGMKSVLYSLGPDTAVGIQRIADSATRDICKVMPSAFQVFEHKRDTFLDHIGKLERQFLDEASRLLP